MKNGKIEPDDPDGGGQAVSVISNPSDPMIPIDDLPTDEWKFLPKDTPGTDWVEYRRRLANLHEFVNLGECEVEID